MDINAQRTPHRSSSLIRVTTGGVKSVYGIDAFPTGADTAVAVITEFPDNPGRSVTHEIEVIRTQVLLYWLPEYQMSQVIWVERYLAGSRGAQGEVGETFDLVQFSKDGRPFWRPLGNRTEEDFWKICFGARPSHLALFKNHERSSQA